MWVALSCGWCGTSCEIWGVPAIAGVAEGYSSVWCGSFLPGSIYGVGIHLVVMNCIFIGYVVDFPA